MATNSYNPDVLNCLANLSNDEVFTPPELANRILDLLPQELFQSPDTKFLDPFSKSGVFLREIVKRLDRGLEKNIPERQSRIDHILHNQVFGIAITELTSYLSRRSLYCSMHADGKYSVSRFSTECGNILYSNRFHTWENGKCRYCGASRAVYDRGSEAEQYAYMFIHTDTPGQFFENMKFDVIVGNPPYQLSDGGAQASAMPIYNLFVSQAMRLKPRYLSMIIPARWYGGGRGLDEFRSAMIRDKRIRVLHDFLNASDCFGTGVEIKGGVCYFLWERDNEGTCRIFTHNGESVKEQPERYLKEKNSDVFIRYAEGVSVYKKVVAFKEKTLEPLVSAQRPFGLRTFAKGKSTKFHDAITLYQNGGVGYITRDEVDQNKKLIDEYKIYISRAYNAGDTYPHQIIGKPILGKPGSCCTETYVTIGPFENEEETKNVISYIHTKFFRFMVFLTKVSQMASSKVYQFVPIQDFSHPWTDEMLYKKYGLDGEEIAFIESMIRPME
mgnify:FL=1